MLNSIAVQCSTMWLTYRYLSCPDRWSLDMPKQPHMRETRELFASLSLALMRGGPHQPWRALWGLLEGHKGSVVTAQGLNTMQQAGLLACNAGGGSRLDNAWFQRLPACCNQHSNNVEHCSRSDIKSLCPSDSDTIKVGCRAPG